jgi:hypothetical protein
LDFLKGLFAKPPYPAQHKQEVETRPQDLIQIGKTEDFLSERPAKFSTPSVARTGAPHRYGLQ